MSNIIKKDCLFYCKDCNKINNSCYYVDDICCCNHCFSTKIEIIEKDNIKKIIRKKRLEHLNEIKNKT